MAVQHLEASVRHQNGAAIVDLRGEINAFAEEVLDRAYDDASRASESAVVLNFAAVDYINSTGIALIVGLLARARKSGLRLLTYGLSDHYVEIFKITRLADFMGIFPDEATAL